MKLNNQLIYNYAKNLLAFKNCNIKMPVRINFYLQKNIQLIEQAAADIEQARLDLGSQYGTINETNTGYDIPAENLELVSRELNDLFSLEQELDIHLFKLSDFDGIDLEYQQMSAIMFMIEE